MTYLKIFYWRLLALWHDNKPAQCFECRRWMKNKHAKRERTTTGRAVVLCKRCWLRYFRPFRK